MSVPVDSCSLSVCIGGILSAPSSHWQINERCGFEEWGWCGLPQQKRQSQVEGGVCGCLSRCGEGPHRGLEARGGIGGGRPLGQGRSGVPRLGVSPPTVGQWDSGTGTVAVACRPARKREIGEVLPPRPLPLFQRQAAGPVSRPPSDRRVHVCTKHQAPSTKRPMPKPPMHKHTTTNETIVPFPSRSHFFPSSSGPARLAVFVPSVMAFRFGRFVSPPTPAKHPTLIDK